jgi:Fe2+ or Zn2+ uptake regulation protein
MDPADRLRRNFIPVTAQRLAVLRTVSALPHGTVDAIAQEVRASLGVVSQQAVYDSLHLLVEKGLIRRIQPAGSPTLYEDRVGDNHHHLICRGCGKAVDVDCAVGHAPCLHASNSAGFEIDEAEVIYWGTCPECRAAAESSPG